MSPDDIRAVISESQTRINGKATPELVPFDLRMKLFFYRYGDSKRGYREDLSTKLSEQDDAILTSYAAEHSAALAADEEQFRLECIAVYERTPDMSAVEIATEIEAATHRSETRAAKRYREVLRRLSADGQRIVTNYTELRVRPSITRDNQVTQAMMAPDWYKQQILRLAEAARNGSNESQAATIPPPRPDNAR